MTFSSDQTNSVGFGFLSFSERMIAGSGIVVRRRVFMPGCKRS
jgi:hypothetical protein